MSRDTKRWIIVGTYILLFAGFGFSVYATVKPQATCTDGKQNQNEAGIDCGGVCGACAKALPAEDLQVREVNVVYGGQNKYDVMANLYNPNDRYGASEFSYTFFVKDAQGNIIMQRSGKSFILPKESKHILEIGLDSSEPIDRVGIEVSRIEWQLFSGYQEQPAIKVFSKNFEYTASGTGFAKASGVVENQSPYDFQSIVIKVILRDASGKPIAFNSTEQRTVAAGQRRDFSLVWPSSFPGEVDAAKMETEVEADVYHSDNFIRQYVPSNPVSGF